jgi:ribosomal protein S27AE
MSEKKYRVVLQPLDLRGPERARVVRALAGLFRRDEVFVEKLLSRAPVVVKKSVGLEAAQRHQLAIKKLGVAVRVEEAPPEAPRPSSQAPRQAQKPRPETKRPPGKEESCPQCGYIPGKHGDLRIVNGECPRCGYVAGKSPQGPSVQSSASPRRTEELAIGVFAKESAYASWGKRFLATISTLSLFLSIHMIIVILVVLILASKEKRWILVGDQFLKSLVAIYPAFISIISVFVVSVLIPLLNEGRTLGQRLAGIRLRSLREGGEDRYMQITMRSLAIVFLTYIPGLLIILLSGLIRGAVTFADQISAAVVLAIMAWTANSLISMVNDQGRSFVDMCSQVIQENERDVGPKEVGLALGPLVFVVFMLVVFGLIIPLS